MSPGDRANEYDASCARCGGPVPAGAGLLRHGTKVWEVYHPEHAPEPGPPPRGDHPGWHRRRLLSLDIGATGNRPAVDRIRSAALRGSDGTVWDGVWNPGPEVQEAGPGSRVRPSGPGFRVRPSGPGSQAQEGGPGPEVRDAGRGPEARQSRPGPAAWQSGPGSQDRQSVPAPEVEESGPRARTRAPAGGSGGAPHADPAASLDELATLVADHLAAGELLVVWFAPYVLTMLHAELLRHELPSLAARLPSGVAPVCDPLVLDRHVDRYRPGSRSLRAVAEWYGVPHASPGDPASDAGAALLVARAVAECHPPLARLSRPALHTEQILWYAEQTSRHPGALAWPFAPTEPLPWEPPPTD
ncbi:hypothetical protein ACIRTB_11875 [Streptomyces sp. NPDC101158]|uniref:hypothetical protein n=1 Tax=Streptomyces sp. NPDC101158 TaxID=3366117 RepID=UPI0037F8C6CE